MRTELRFQPMDRAGLATFMAWFSDAELSRRITAPTEPWFHHVSARPENFAWLVYDGEQAVGQVQLDTFPEGTGSISLVVSPALRARGYGKRILSAFLLREEAQRLGKIVACIDADNTASLRCFQAMGFLPQRTEPDRHGLMEYAYAHERHQAPVETFVTSRGGRIWTVSKGQGLPLLLCNGGPGCCDYLAPVADMLAGTAQAIRFEPSGCGRSDSTPPYDIDACLEDMESIRCHYGIEHWIVGGHSWGADLALIYALQYPERVSGFLCISGGRFHNDREWHRLYAERQAAGREVLPEFQHRPNMEVNQQGNLSWKDYIQRPSLWKDLSEMDRPGLFLYGAEDIRPSWPVEQVAALMPNAQFSAIAGADHHIWTSHSDQMRALLLDFVERMETERNRP